MMNGITLTNYRDTQTLHFLFVADMARQRGGSRRLARLPGGYPYEGTEWFRQY